MKLYPTASVVRTSSEDTVNVMAVPCAVVPFHWPTLSDEGDGDVAPLLHVEASTPASVATHSIACVLVRITIWLRHFLLLLRTARVLRVCPVRLTAALTRRRSRLLRARRVQREVSPLID